jgi:2-succinyl-6-hydroxy-2,4-cyclohexadiene-1-carboxylate synthase
MIRKQHKHIKIRGINYGYRVWEPDVNVDTESEKLVILLHGFMGSGAIFEELSLELAHDTRVITLDLLGHGSSEGAEMHYRFSTNEQVADLRTFIERMNDRPVILMGYSMGARLALSFAVKYPQLLAGLILESGSFGIEDPTEAQTRQSLDGHRADEIQANFNDFLVRWNAMPLFQSLHSKVLPSEYATIQKFQDPFWMANSLLGFGTGTMPCLHHELAKLEVPTQLMVGGDDTKFMAINQRMHQQIPNSYLSIIRKSGHRVHVDAPEQWLQTVQPFIQHYL